MDAINIAAIIFGPVFAVVITLWWQQRKEKRDAKIRLFTTLMAFRKAYPISYEWARSLNLIDVVFADSATVLDQWHQYYAFLQRQNLNPNELQEQNHKYLELMSAMAASLGFRKLQQTNIDKFYIPQLHATQADLNATCQMEWLRVLRSTSHFVVVPRTTVEAGQPDGGANIRPALPPQNPGGILPVHPPP
jgi:Family of unknown function (DUF6680)